MIKTRIVEKAENSSNEYYPKVKVFESYGKRKVVLFHKELEGTVLYSDFPEEYPGYFYSRWNEDRFERFHGEINIKVD